jgi:N-acetylmuramate 1-kinase
MVEALGAEAVLDRRITEFLLEHTGKGPNTLAVAALTGDASTRRYFRVAAPEGTSILALYPEPFVADDLPFLSIRDLMAGWGLPVPAVLAWDAERGIVLQEDLGDTTLQDALPAVGDARRDELYRQAIDQLVRLQQAAAGSSKAAPCFRVAFDIEKLSWELHYFLKHFVEGLRARELGVEDRATLSEGFHRLAEEIASWPRVLCHRDFHSRNLMIHDGGLHWIDFQDARMGPATYDLASLLRDSYVDLPEDFVSERAEELRQSALPQEARDTFLHRFELTSIQRNLKALGTFGYMTVVAGKTVYERYVPRTLALARSALARRPELAGIHRVLANHIEELA